MESLILTYGEWSFKNSKVMIRHVKVGARPCCHLKSQEPVQYMISPLPKVQILFSPCKQWKNEFLGHSGITLYSYLNLGMNNWSPRTKSSFKKVLAAPIPSDQPRGRSPENDGWKVLEGLSNLKVVPKLIKNWILFNCINFCNPSFPSFLT